MAKIGIAKTGSIANTLAMLRMAKMGKARPKARPKAKAKTMAEMTGSTITMTGGTITMAEVTGSIAKMTGGAIQ